jgi:hypothetical protein
MIKTDQSRTPSRDRLGIRSTEHGTWNMEHGACNLEPGPRDGRWKMEVQMDLEVDHGGGGNCNNAVRGT